MAPGDSISEKVRILIDMDGVLCDWERKLFETQSTTTITALNSILAHFLEHYKKLWPGRPFIPLENRKAFLVRNDYKDQLGITNPNEVYEQEGWFFNLPPVQGTAKLYNTEYIMPVK